MKVEEKYKDVLHTIESCVIPYYLATPSIKDYDVSLVYEALYGYMHGYLDFIKKYV